MKVLDCNSYRLEDNNIYLVISTIEDENNVYHLLSEENMPSNICIRKIEKNNPDFITRLTTYEFNEMFEKFEEKILNLFE